jgi:uncharacterized protein YkwD
LRQTLFAALGGCLILTTLATRAFAGEREDAVLEELNYVRAHPADYALELQDEVTSGRRGLGYSSVAAQDPEALEDAIDFLERQAPLPALHSDGRLAACALNHSSVQGPQGGLGHGGPGGVTFSQRLKHEGVWAGLAAEAISYGYDSPRDVIRQLVIDSGVANRGHRRDIFGRSYQVAGVSCARHALWGAMCVIDFAGALVAR